MLDTTEIGSWWLRPIDRVLNSDSLEQSPWFGAVTRRVADIHNTSIERWGDVQELQMPNLLLDFLPRWTGFKKGPFPLEGGRATPRQGQLIPTRHGESALGPAYRMISDLAEDCIWTSLPGGISGNPLNDSSSKWLQEWLDGSYHRLAPPTLDEATLPFDILSS